MIRRALILAVPLLALLPGSAGAHALLERTEPERGAGLQSPPNEVAFFFSEPVEASFGAVRVFEANGDQVETGEIVRPEGKSDAVAVELPSDLADGTYTATYRVISADSHPVSGGFVFSVGDPGAGPAESVSELLDQSDVGPVSDVAYWAARWLGYAAIGLGVGLLAFLVIVWAPALASTRERNPAWTRAEVAFASRAHMLFWIAGLTGLLASLAALVLQAATAAGVSFWSALDPDLIGEVLDTRFGRLTAVRAGAWALVVAVLLARGVDPSNARLGPVASVVLGLSAGVVLITPALAGHAATQDPTWLLLPADVAHVAAMSVWLGGLAALALALPSATRALPDVAKSALLAGALVRFSPIALAAVLVLVVGGLIQAIVYVGPLSDFVDTAFGRAILIKATLLLGLVGLGWLNRARLLPDLREVAERRQAPGRAGQLIRRTLRAEVATIVVVLGVTAALVSYPPPSEAETGPVSGSIDVGAARLDYTVDPARVGSNVMHLYLFEADSGAQFTGAKEVRVDLTLPEADIGPIEAELRRAGPGHYVAPGTPFGVEGDWQAEITLRVSRFEQVEVAFEVPIK